MQATRLIGCLAVALLAVPIGARAAEGESEQLQALEERMRVLEDKLAASSATIEAQQELLQRTTPPVSQGSAMDGFFNKLEVSGAVTGSYIYNFNNPQTPASGFGTQPLNQFNNRHNEFSLDAAKFEVSKTAASPGEAGFTLDLLYGQNGDILRNNSSSDPGNLLGGSGVSDDGVFVQEAYATYNLSGVTFKLGKFETLLGYEVLDSYKNPNVTHGLLYTFAIPLYHEGLLATGAITEGVSWSAGIVNGFNNVIENNDGKAFVGQIAGSAGPLGGAFNVFYGSETSDPPDPGTGGTLSQPGTTDDLMILDAVATFNASDTISLWLNADYGMQDDQTVTGQASDKDADYWGVAVGSKIKLSEKLAFAVRGEYIEDPDALRFSFVGTPTDNSDVKAYSATGTLSYMLAQNLMMRGEFRWDHVDEDLTIINPSGSIFPEGSTVDGNFDDNSYLGLVEVSYIFD